MSNTQTAAKWEAVETFLYWDDKQVAQVNNAALTGDRQQIAAEMVKSLNSTDALAAENAALREALKALYDNVTAISNIGFDDDTLDAFEQARVALEGGAN